MIINDDSIKVIENLICEGIVCKNRATEGKKHFVDAVFAILRKIYEENGIETSDWIMTQMNTIVIDSKVRSAEDDSSYYNNLWDYCLQLLQDIRSTYYVQKQLEESKKQTGEAEKQTKEAMSQTEEARKSNNTAIGALVASGFAVVVAIIAICVSQCTHTIHVDDSQYDEVKTILLDSLAKTNY